MTADGRLGCPHEPAQDYSYSGSNADKESNRFDEGSLEATPSAEIESAIADTLPADQTSPAIFLQAFSTLRATPRFSRFDAFEHACFPLFANRLR
ncbi:hypothetical protein [Amycolatopsis sp. NPDC059657]|uniref:hypothetical protein n=1 Tax=Amycolatopsis sp. NPDC059657 TaxID=3346899 RepID=UPI0036715C47